MSVGLAFRSLTGLPLQLRPTFRRATLPVASPPAGEWPPPGVAMTVSPVDDTRAMTPTRLDLDDVVAVATIVEAMLGRPMTPNESSRLKSAYQRGGTLTGFADQIAA